LKPNAHDCAAIGDVRAQFPSLSVTDDGQPRVYFDNPAGTQVPRHVIDRIASYLATSSANYGGHFRTSRATVDLIATTRTKLAAFCNAGSSDEIVIGPNMTSLTFAMSRHLEPLFRQGDEILLTRMDHDGNVSPWMLLARRLGLEIRWLEFDTRSYRYSMHQLDDLITERTRLAAINYASNITGTINDVAAIAARVKAAGGMTYVDAVQFAPHGDIDVGTLGCDFLVCSAYKFYGPHVGVLWGRSDLLDTLSPAKLRAAPDRAPERFETGCANFESIAGVLGALEYYEWLGRAHGAKETRSVDLTARDAISAGKAWMRTQEDALAARLIEGLAALPGVTIHGLTAAADLSNRVSTVSVTVRGHKPDDLARALADHNVFVWSGHNYALEVIDHLGLADRGGVLRFGPVHYNTLAEVDRVIAIMGGLLSRRA
jgi:cysteine desulfurase family protein (TIGR01976 family)